MAGYIGTKPAVKGRYIVDEFTSSGGTTYTLSRTPSDKNNMQVSAGGLVQYPSAYSFSGTTLTLSGVPTGQKVLVRHFGDTSLYPALDDNVVTGAKIALGSDAAGDTMYYNGTDYARLAKGTAGQALVMNSGATAPEWGAAGGGAWEYIATGTASDTASLVFSSGITSTYSIYVFSLKNVVPITAGADLVINFSTDGGSSYLSAGCHVANSGYDSSDANRYHRATNDTGITVGDNVSGTAGSGVSGMVYMTDPSDSGTRPMVNFWVQHHYNPNAHCVPNQGCGFRTSNSVVNAVKWAFSSGNIEAGQIRMYGIADS